MFHPIRTTLAGLVLSAAFLIAAPAQAGPSTDFIKKTTSEVTTLLQQKDSAKRQQAFSAKLNATVDFEELAARALGDYWKEQPAEQQKKFLDLLQEMLKANYRDKLTGQQMGKDFEVEYTDERARDSMAIVDTLIKAKDQSRPVSYKLLKRDGGWVIYDVVIDDISLVETYRDSYTAIIKKHGWDGLISRMEKKVAELEKAGPSAKK